MPDINHSRQAIRAIEQEGGRYAPLDDERIENAKNMIRRRREPARGSDIQSNNANDAAAELGEQRSQPAAIPGKWNTSVNATIVVIFGCILAAIPGSVGWSHSLGQNGKMDTADFYFLVQGAIMQLIGVGTVILPLALTRSLFPQKWFWTWLLTFVSVACPIAASVSYCYMPTEWSASIMYVGSAAQILVTLQALFLVKRVKLD